MPLEIRTGDGDHEIIHGGYSEEPQRQLLAPEKWAVLLALLEEVGDALVDNTAVHFEVWNKSDGPATRRGMVTQESAPELGDPVWRKAHGYPRFKKADA
jgi:hypothetical protein